MSVAEQAVELARRLNDPSWAAGATSISQELQRIQLSPQGWAIADAMLEHTDPNIKFFGALTLQIKLNKNRHTLDEQAAVELISRLISWFVRFTCQNERRLVLDKLCSVLATYFIQSPVPWTQALRQIICSLHAEDVVPIDSLANHPDTSQIISQLSPPKLFMAIHFCRVLAEDVTSGANLGAQYYHLDGLLKTNTTDSAILLTYTLKPSTPVSSEIRAEAIDTFSAWVAYGHSHWTTDPVALQLLQTITPLAAEYLLNSDEILRDPTVELFVNILEFRSKFLQKEQREMISVLVRRTVGPQCLSQIQSDPGEPTVVASGKLIAAYGRLIVKDLISKRDHESSQEIVALFQQLLCAPGYPAEEDEIILSATEFWTEYAEHALDALIESFDEQIPFLAVVRADLMQAVQAYIPKLRPPPRHEMSGWDEDNIDRWEFFRDNISDFLESVNSIPDTNLLANMIALALNVLPSKQWLDLEAILFAINCISDSIALNDENTQALSTLIGSSLFSDISSNSADVPTKLKKAAMILIDRYSSFIKRNPQFLPPVLTFLFTTLATAPVDKVKLADASAKSFESLCSSCRKALTPHLDELLQQCPQALSGPSGNSYQKEKVMAGLASIIQALPTEAAKAEPLIALIEVVEDDLNNAINALQVGNLDDGEVLGTTALQCLASIGKGIQAPADDVVDVEEDDKNGDSADADNFWTAQAGAQIQGRILHCFSIVEYLQSQGDAIDAACAVLRSGLTETEPGPFVFPPSAIVAFVQRAQVSTPRVEAILGTACSFVSRYSRTTTTRLFNEMLAVYDRVALIMRQLGEPANDPQVAQLCVDFIQRLLSRYVDVLLAPADDALAGVLDFVIMCIFGNAPMLKRQAANFWETLIGIANPRVPLPQPPCRVSPSSVVAAFAPSLCRALIFNIGGQASRSEIEGLCKPLRALVFTQQGLAKQYLQEALLDPGFPSSLVGDAAKKTFLAKVMGLRGGARTGAVVMEFWAECKGTVTSFE